MTYKQEAIATIIDCYDSSFDIEVGTRITKVPGKELKFVYIENSDEYESLMVDLTADHARALAKYLIEAANRLDGE